MRHDILVPSLEDLPLAARQFLGEIGERSIIALHAPMGAGKTTFTSAICRELGVEEDAIGSPTFAIVNEYRTKDKETIYHFDFYRIDKLEEALDLGLYDYLDSGCLCIMEWPENVEELLPEETLWIDISVLEDGARLLSWED